MKTCNWYAYKNDGNEVLWLTLGHYSVVLNTNINTDKYLISKTNSKKNSWYTSDFQDLFPNYYISKRKGIKVHRTWSLHFYD